MANSEPIFSKVFRGFSPDEVIAYIDVLNAAYKNAKAEQDARLNALTDELNAAKRENEENTSLKALVEEKQRIIDEQNAKLEILTNDTENQRLAITQQGEKIAELEETVVALKGELEAAGIKNAAMEKNSKEYEDILADVDGILASARRKAKELIEEADRRAEIIISDAEKEARLKTDRIISESDEHLIENAKKVKYLSRRQNELAELFKEHKSKVDSFFASISNKK